VRLDVRVNVPRTDEVGAPAPEAENKEADNVNVPATVLVILTLNESTHVAFSTINDSETGYDNDEPEIGDIAVRVVSIDTSGR